MTDVHLLGVRGSTPTPGPAFVRYGGDTSCVALAPDGGPPELLLDLGTGARHLGDATRGAAFLGNALLTHLHWDHTHGLPFASMLDHPAAEVVVHVPGQGRADVRDVLARAIGPPHFPVTAEELRGRWSVTAVEEGWTALPFVSGTARVLAREVPHKGGRTFGYRVELPDGAVVTYVPDHHPGRLGPGPDGVGPYHDAIVELAWGADLLLHDAQYTAEEYPDRAHFGHSAIGYAIGLGRRAGATTTVLFHHDPGRTDAELDAVAAAHAGDAGVVVAVQGTVLRVGGGGSTPSPRGAVRVGDTWEPDRAPPHAPAR